MPSCKGAIMTSLEQARAMAQRYANSQQKPYIVLNLNPYSPLYVVREYGGHYMGRNVYELVEVVQPLYE